MIETQGDVGHALLNLERDLEIDLDFLIDDNPALNRAIALAAAQSEDATDLQPGTYETAMRIMGLPAPQSTGDPAVQGQRAQIGRMGALGGFAQCAAFGYILRSLDGWNRREKQLGE